MGICSDCKHWTEFDIDAVAAWKRDHGLNLIGCGDCEAVGAFGIYGSRGGTGAIYTAHDFGCLKFEPK